MSKKVKEENEVISSKPAKRETFATIWFRDNCVNDVTEVKRVCELTARSANEQFHFKVKSDNYEVYAVVFFATFMTILEYIKKKESEYNNYTIEICNSINIGFTNNDSEDNEKVGNFMPIMEYIGVNRNIINPTEVGEIDASRKNFLMWKELNVKKNIEQYKEIQENAYNKLYNEFGTDLRTSEGILPLFCIFMDNITAVLKVKFKEAQGTDVSEVSINILGLFDVYYSFNEEDNKEIIEFDPNITMKLKLKSDDTAAR